MLDRQELQILTTGREGVPNYTHEEGELMYIDD